MYNVNEFPFSVYVSGTDSLDFRSAHKTVSEAKEYARRERKRSERCDGSTDDVYIIDERSGEFVED